MAYSDHDLTKKDSKSEQEQKPPRDMPTAHGPIADALGLEWIRPIQAMQRQAEWLRKTIEDAQRLSEPARSFSQALEQLFAPSRWLQDAIQRLSQQRQQLVNQVIDHGTEPIRRMIRDIAASTKHIQQWWEEFERRCGYAEKSAAPILRRYKWFVTPSLPITFVFLVVKEGRKAGRRDKDINRMFIDYFAAENWQALEDMVDGWKDRPLLAKRLPILRDCVRTLQAADVGGSNAANVVLPALIAQIDGVLADYLDSKAVPRRTKYVQKKRELIKRKNSVLSGPLEEVALSVILDTLFQEAHPGQPLETPFHFNRHKIMHGENVRYGRKDYVIRAFLALDYLAYLQ